MKIYLSLNVCYKTPQSEKNLNFNRHEMEANIINEVYLDYIFT